MTTKTIMELAAELVQLGSERGRMLIVGASADALRSNVQRVDAIMDEINRQVAELANVDTIGPRYPQGTAKYDAYMAELKTELAKWASGQPPYPYE